LEKKQIQEVITRSKNARSIDTTKIPIYIKVDTKALVKKIQSLDMKVFETKITMKNKVAEDALANFILKQVHI